MSDPRDALREAEALLAKVRPEECGGKTLDLVDDALVVVRTASSDTPARTFTDPAEWLAYIISGQMSDGWFSPDQARGLLDVLEAGGPFEVVLEET